MKRYLTSLLVVTVVFGALVFVTSVPFSKAGTNPTCLEFCEEAILCACAGKVIGNLRETKCQFQGCVASTCNCEPDPKCFDKKERDESWLKFPQPVSTPLDCFFPGF
jgi:hypothetical protein